MEDDVKPGDLPKYFNMRKAVYNGKRWETMEVNK